MTEQFPGQRTKAPRRIRFPIGPDLLGSDPSTEPIPLVKRLRGTPFQHAKDQIVPDDILEAIDIVLRIAALSIRTGAGMKDVETHVLASAAALGLADDHLEFDLTFTSAIISYAPPGIDPVVRVRVVRAPGRNYARMTLLHRLVLDMVDGSLTRVQAKERLHEVESSHRPYNRSAVRVAWAFMTALIVLRLGGDAIAVGTSFGATIVVDRIGEFLSRRGIPLALTILCGSAMATTIAMVVGHLGASTVDATDPLLVARTSLVIAGGVMMLLPGLLIVSVVEDGLWDYPITASARLFQVLIQVIAILAGIAIPYAIVPSIGAEVPQMGDPLAGVLSAPAWTYVAITLAATLAIAIGNRVPRRLLLVAALLGGLGNVVQLVVNAAGLPAAVGVLGAAFVIGALGKVLASRRNAPSVALTVAAVTPLLPGLSVVESIRIMTHGDAAEGAVRLLSAGTTACAIGAGVVIGAMLAGHAGDGMARVARKGSEWVGKRYRRRSEVGVG